MEGNQWVDQVRRLLEKAKTQQSAAFVNLDAMKASIDAACMEIKRIQTVRSDHPETMPYSLRRRLLLQTITVRSRHYALQDEIQLFVYQLGREALQSLSNAELEGVSRWLERTIERIETSPS